jgi:hypothetical protein
MGSGNLVPAETVDTSMNIDELRTKCPGLYQQVFVAGFDCGINCRGNSERRHVSDRRAEAAQLIANSGSDPRALPGFTIFHGVARLRYNATDSCLVIETASEKGESQFRVDGFHQIHYRPLVKAPGE